MQLSKTLCIAFAATASFLSAHAQSVDDIISKHIDAIGGKEKLSQVATTYIQGTLQAMGNNSNYSIYMLNGKDFLLKADFNGQTLTQCYTDSSGWTINPFEGGAPAPMSSDEYKAAKYQLFFPDIFATYPENGVKAMLMGQQDSTYKIQVTMPDSTQSTYYIDTASYLITQEVGTGFMQGNQVTITNQFSNYQKTDAGIIIPFASNSDFGDFSISRTIDTINFNKPIDSAMFKMPAQ
jgi:hypothetical protein